MELEPEAVVQLRRCFDGMHFLLTPARLAVGLPLAGTLLPPTAAKTTEAPKSSAVA